MHACHTLQSTTEWLVLSLCCTLDCKAGKSCSQALLSNKHDEVAGFVVLFTPSRWQQAGICVMTNQ